MGGKTPRYEAPAPDPSQVAYNNYMLTRQQKIDAASDLAAEDAKTQATTIANTGKTGFDSYYDLIQKKVNAGLLGIDAAKQQVKDYEDRYKLGTGYTQNKANELESGYLAGEKGRNETLAKQTYKDTLQRDATQAELDAFGANMATGKYNFSDLTNTIKSGSEYQDKFNQSYLDNYYDTMYGKQTTTTDASGKTIKTGKRTIKIDRGADPIYSGDLGVQTGINFGNESETEFSGTPDEIDARRQAERQARGFKYNAGLTQLQGQIDKDTQKIKNEGAKDVAQISTKGQILSNLTQGFWS